MSLKQRIKGNRWFLSIRKRLHRLSHRSACVIAAILIVITSVTPGIIWPSKAQAAITYVSSSGAVVNTAATSIVINKPASVLEGDYMVATITTAVGRTITPPSGWSSILVSGSGPALESFRHVVSASEPSSYTFTLNSAAIISGGITAYRGVDTTGTNGANGIDTSGAAASGSGNTLTTVSGLPTNSPNTLVLGRFGLYLATGLLGNVTTISVTNNHRFSADTRCSGGCTNTSTAAGDVAMGAAGSSIPSQTATASNSPNWAAHVVVLKQAIPSVSQSAYRFSVNADNNDPSYAVSNPSSGEDLLNGNAIDNINSVFYAVGETATDGVIEKRNVINGALCTAAMCGTEFGSGGKISTAVASATVKYHAIAVDPSGGYIYVSGTDSAAGGGQFRIEKRNMHTGALIPGFGVNGVVQTNVTAGDDTALTIVADVANNYLYVGGYDSGGNSSRNQWSLHKYRADNGNICTAANCGTQFGTNGIYTYTVGGNLNNRLTALEADPLSTYLFVAGYSTANNGRTEWTMVKMLASNAALCTAANCGTQFGTNGIFTSDPSTRDDNIQSLQVDSAGGAIYLGGYEQHTSTAQQWRMEKIRMDTGAYFTDFGGSGCLNNVAGAICMAFSTGYERITDMSLDGAGGYLYVMGTANETSSDSSWRLQKRNRSDGSLVSGWATSGTAIMNPDPAQQDPASRLAIDVNRGILWAMGGDRSLGSTNMQWRYIQLSLDSGTIWLAPQDTIAGLSSRITFRLRMLLGISAQPLYVSYGQQFKLQYSPKLGTCDTGFVGESYTDVQTSSGEIQHHSNPLVSDGTAAVALSGDPAVSGQTTVNQTVEQANNFTNTTAVYTGQQGLWDFVLRDVGAYGAYCFRAINSDNSLLNSYTVIPEITFCKDDPKTESVMRHGQYFCEGLKKNYFWVQF